MFRIGRITVLLALSLLLSAGGVSADLFELPDSAAPAAPGSVTVATPLSPNLPLRDRKRATQATLAEHAVYYAFTELGIGPEKQADITLKLSQMESVRSLPPEKAFLAGIRMAGRIQDEMDDAAGPASLAARNTLLETAAYRTALPLAAGSPANAAARLEQAIAGAKAAIIYQRPRFQYTKWLTDILIELAKSPA